MSFVNRFWVQFQCKHTQFTYFTIFSLVVFYFLLNLFNFYDWIKDNFFLIKILKTYCLYIDSYIQKFIMIGWKNFYTHNKLKTDVKAVDFPQIVLLFIYLKKKVCKICKQCTKLRTFESFY